MIIFRIPSFVLILHPTHSTPSTFLPCLSISFAIYSFLKNMAAPPAPLSPYLYSLYKTKLYPGILKLSERLLLVSTNIATSTSLTLLTILTFFPNHPLTFQTKHLIINISIFIYLRFYHVNIYSFKGPPPLPLNSFFSSVLFPALNQGDLSSLLIKFSLFIFLFISFISSKITLCYSSIFFHMFLKSD